MDAALSDITAAHISRAMSDEQSHAREFRDVADFIAQLILLVLRTTRTPAPMRTAPPLALTPLLPSGPETLALVPPLPPAPPHEGNKSAKMQHAPFRKRKAESECSQPLKKPASDGPTLKKMNSKQRRDKLRRAQIQEQVSGAHTSVWSARTIRAVLDATDRRESRQEFLTLESILFPPRFDQRMGPGTMIPTRRAFILARMDEPLDELPPPPDP